MSFWGNLFGGRQGETTTDADSRSETDDTPAERQDEAEADPPPAATAKAEDKLDTPLPEDQSHVQPEEESDGVARDIVFAPPPSPRGECNTDDGSATSSRRRHTSRRRCQVVAGPSQRRTRTRRSGFS